MIKDGIEHGSERFFEYHCWESHASGDAELWYRSHQRVTVLECVNPEYGDMSLDQRCEAGHGLVYRVQFSDGHVGDCFEDELLESEASYHRPDPPARPELCSA